MLPKLPYDYRNRTASSVVSQLSRRCNSTTRGFLYIHRSLRVHAVKDTWDQLWPIPSLSCSSSITLHLWLGGREGVLRPISNVWTPPHCPRDARAAIGNPSGKEFSRKSRRSSAEKAEDGATKTAPGACGLETCVLRLRYLLRQVGLLSMDVLYRESGTQGQTNRACQKFHW